MKFDLLSMTDLDLTGKRVIIREDLNVPIVDGKITSDARIQRALPTLRAALAAGASVLVLSHLGRPTEGDFNAEYSLAPVAQALTQALGENVALISDWLEGFEWAPGKVALAENVRFLKGEKANDDVLAQKMAKQCDVFVMDAFATAHRAQASTAGIAEHAPIACAGPLLLTELKALSKALKEPSRPLAAIVGGSKVSTKIQVLDSLIDKVDILVVGGGIANTFLAAQGYAVGQSLYEKDWLDRASALLKKAQDNQVNMPLPSDVRVATEFNAHAASTVREVSEVADNELILDVGPTTSATYDALMSSAQTIVWNGPVGVFEFNAFSEGTKALGQAIAQSNAFSIAGGGDTLSALDQFNIYDKMSYVSTGGGAFLELLEGKSLPAVAILQARTKNYV